eukprot:2537915-Rhodomonas_salina.5
MRTDLPAEFLDLWDLAAAFASDPSEISAMDPKRSTVKPNKLILYTNAWSCAHSTFAAKHQPVNSKALHCSELPLNSAVPF